MHDWGIIADAAGFGKLLTDAKERVEINEKLVATGVVTATKS